MMTKCFGLGLTWSALLFLLCLLMEFQVKIQGFTKSSLKRVPFLASMSELRMVAGVSDIVNVNLGDRTYPIYIGQQLIDSDDILSKHVTSKKALIVTNDNIGPIYTERVRSKLQKQGVEVFEVQLPDGEEYKTMDNLMKIVDCAMENKLDRKSTMIALGGGVVGDMTGFAAAIYLRGIKFVQMPTSLMAMVDSSVGGKTAVNHPLGKNMIGAFYQPDAVVIDTQTLDTLPTREYISGISEVIKYGLIRDTVFFEWLEANMPQVVSREPAILCETIRRSCENKAAVVAADEKEGGIRATLNLGHTFGHAIENGMGYGVWLHGEAVGTGMIMAADMSRRKGMISDELYDRIIAISKAAKLPVTLINEYAINDLGGKAQYDKRAGVLNEGRFVELMYMDKKVADGTLNLILLKGELGKCVITSDFEAEELDDVVNAYMSEL